MLLIHRVLCERNDMKSGRGVTYMNRCWADWAPLKYCRKDNILWVPKKASSDYSSIKEEKSSSKTLLRITSLKESFPSAQSSIELKYRFLCAVNMRDSAVMFPCQHIWSIDHWRENTMQSKGRRCPKLVFCRYKYRPGPSLNLHCNGKILWVMIERKIWVVKSSG